MNLFDPVDWFTPWERDVWVMLFGRAVFPCRVLGSTSCNATAFRAASHMAMALVGVLINDKRSLRGRFSDLFSWAPWHTSFPPGEEQPTGSPTKASLPEWVMECWREGRLLADVLGETKENKGQNFCTLSFLVLTACRYAGFGGGWRDVERSGQVRIKAVIEGLTKGVSSPGFAYHWAEQGRYRMSRCCRKLENSERGKCCKTQQEQRGPEAVARGLSASACSSMQRLRLRCCGRAGKGRTPKWMLLSPGESPAVAGSKWTGSTLLERSRWEVLEFSNNGLDQVWILEQRLHLMLNMPKINEEMQQKVREEVPSIPGMVRASSKELQGTWRYLELKPAHDWNAWGSKWQV